MLISPSHSVYSQEIWDQVQLEARIRFSLSASVHENATGFRHAWLIDVVSLKTCHSI